MAEGTVSYGNKLMGWAQKEGILNSELASYFLNDKVDNHTKHMFANLYAEMENSKRGSYKQQHSHEDEIMHLVPYTDRDGSFKYVNRLTGRVVASMQRQSNGLYSWFGTKTMMENLGGRGLLNQINKDLADGDLFHDVQKRAA